MKHSNSIVAATLTIVSALACNSVFATSTNDLPPAQTQGLVTYLSGGIGQREAKAMESVESKYPLSLEFVQRAKPRDEFLADVNVTITDRSGKTALTAVSDGPFLFANMPNGTYTLRATDNGKTFTRRLVIAKGKPEHVALIW